MFNPKYYYGHKWYRFAWVTWQAHQRTIMKRCVLLAGWPSPKESFQPSSSLMRLHDESIGHLRQANVYCSR
jgi:hypothetical protein